MQKIILLFLLLLANSIKSQFGNTGFLKDKIKEKVNEKFEKKQKDYDESNFNYAILFLDNSSAFEADEKGSAFSSTLYNSSRLVTHEEKTLEDRAYTNLKNGELLFAGNRFYLAEQSFKLAKRLYEEDGQTTISNYAQTVSDLALICQTRGKFTKAKEYSEQALELRKNLSNKGMLLVSINNNAVLKKETGLYAEAEADLKSALDLANSTGDKLARALVHNNLAMTFLEMNNLKDAEIQINLCIEDAETVLKENSSNFIKLLINKANIYRFEKKFNLAEEIYLKCIDIKEKKLGAHPDLAHLKMGLAQLYMEMGKQEQVETLLQNAYDIYKHKLGEKNPATLAVLQQQANYYRISNNPSKSLELMTHVVSAKKIIYGETHPNYIQSLEDLALSQWQNNLIVETKTNYKIVIDNTLNYINNFFNSLNENEKNLYWDKTNLRLQRFYSFAHANSNNNKDLVQLLYKTLVNTKGFLLNNSSKIRNTIFESNDSVLKETYKNWLITKESLSLAYQLSKEELIQENINLDSLTNKSRELEKDLSQRSALFKESIGAQSVSIESLQATLKPNEALIEIVEISEYQNGFNGNEAYVALVLKPLSVQMIELGTGGQIEKAVKDFRDKVIHTKPENEGYALLWKPLEESVKTCTKLYLSLDGAYHKLSIYALKDATGKYLVDKYEMCLMGNSKDLIDIKRSEKNLIKPSTAELFGNPYYGSNGLVQQLEGTELEVKNIAQVLNTFKVKTTAIYG
ncbi:MAG: tetratricopeptide repeat protein, partial [Bacteroidota bacterium]